MTKNKHATRTCPSCSIHIEGDWVQCPLCSTTLTGPTTASPFPAVPLSFSRKKVFQTLVWTSFLLIFASLIVQLFFTQKDPQLGIWRIIWLGLATMWLVVLMAIRKRHNVAKGTVYLVAIIGLLCTYWDYLTGWHGWSLTYVVPIVCGAAIIAVLISVRVMHMPVGDHIVYSGLTALMGTIPVVFWLLNWVYEPLPSTICGVLSVVTLVLLQLSRGSYVRHELAKRLHL